MMSLGDALAGAILPAFFLAALPLAAQPAAAPRAAEAPKEESPAAEKGLVGRVFDVKHRDPGDLAAALRPLGSGARGAAVQASREFRTLTVRDFPENVAAIEAALKRLDVVEPPRSDVELRLFVLVASNGDVAAGRVPEDLKEVLAALRSTLTYRSYSLAGTFVQRVRDGARGIRGEGVTDMTVLEGKGSNRMQLEYQINALSVDTAPSAPASLKLDGFSLQLVGDGRAQLKTDVTLKDGEKVVVGASTVQDKGLVVVVSARVIR